MKKLLFATILVCFYLLAGKASAAEERSGFYLSGSLGNAWLSSERGEFHEQESLRKELGVGVALREWLAVEFNYFKIDSLEVFPFLPSCPTCDIYLPPYEIEMGGYSLSAVFEYEISEFWSVFSRQGVSWNRVDFHDDGVQIARILSLVNPRTESSTEHQFSVGARYSIPQVDGGELKVELIRDISPSVKSESINFGFAYSF